MALSDEMSAAIIGALIAGVLSGFVVVLGVVFEQRIRESRERKARREEAAVELLGLGGEFIGMPDRAEVEALAGRGSRCLAQLVSSLDGRTSNSQQIRRLASEIRVSLSNAVVASRHGETIDIDGTIRRPIEALHALIFESSRQGHAPPG